MELPVACTLSEAELRERRQSLLTFIRRSAVDVQPISNGYVYEFQASSDVFQQLCSLVDLERQCCPFLTFKIAIEPQQPIRLEITGPAESISVIADFFGVA